MVSACMYTVLENQRSRDLATTLSSCFAPVGQKASLVNYVVKLLENLPGHERGQSLV